MTIPMSSMAQRTGTSLSAGGDKIPKGYKAGQLQQFTPEQMNLFQQMFGQVGPDSYLSKLSQGDEAAFAQTEGPAMRQFQGLQGQLASRFSGMGLGGRRSSGFQNTANQASSDFAQDLMARRQDLQRQALMDLMGISGSLLGQRPQERFITPKQKPFWQELLGGVAPAAAQGASQAAMLGLML